jgi:hypothetical protein
MDKVAPIPPGTPGPGSKISILSGPGPKIFLLPGPGLTILISPVRVQRSWTRRALPPEPEPKVFFSPELGPGPKMTGPAHV